MATTDQSRERVESAPTEPAVRAGPLLIKALIFLAIAVAGATAYRFTPLKDWLQPASEAAAWVRQSGFWGAAAFLLGMSVLIVAGVPRLLFCPLAGALFGFWGGLAVIIAGTMASYFAVFQVIRGRKLNPDNAPPLHPKLAFLAGRPGLAAVIVSRMLPVPGMVVTVTLAMCNVRAAVYLMGSFLGLIPEAAPLVLLGAGVLHPAAETPVKLGLATLICILVAWLAIHYLLRRFKHASKA